MTPSLALNPGRMEEMEMKKTTNKYQEIYMVAKAAVETMEEMQKEIERKYIREHNIKDADGSTPKFIWCLDDIDIFEKANEECCKIIVDMGLEDDLNEARNTLKKAEDELINYGLSLAPAGVRKILAEDAKKNYCTKKKIIDLIIKLDTSSVQ